MLLKRSIENMSESDESCESYSSDISNESNFYSETESDVSSESGNRFLKNSKYVLYVMKTLLSPSQCFLLHLLKVRY